MVGNPLLEEKATRRAWRAEPVIWSASCGPRHLLVGASRDAEAVINNATNECGRYGGRKAWKPELDEERAKRADRPGNERLRPPVGADAGVSPKDILIDQDDRPNRRHENAEQ